MKKKLILIGLIVALLMIFAMPVSAASTDDLTYKVTNGNVTITDCLTTASGALIIPSEIEGSPVKSIGTEAFKGCTNLAKITIPNSVTTINAYAFYNCTSLTEIVLPDKLKLLSGYAFYNCTSLEKVTIPKSLEEAESYGYSPFYGCRKLTTVTLEEGTTKIIPYLFQDCTGLKEFSIPSTVKSIGTEAFKGCTNLAKITIPNSVTTIGNSAFYDCKNLTNIAIPNSVTSIGSYAFYNCTSLTKITVPNNVTSIGNATFWNCTSLMEVVIPDSVTSIGYNAFYRCPNILIKCNEDSYATIFAINNDLPVSFLGGEYQDSPSLSLKRSDCNYVVNTGSITADGYVSFVVDYGFKSNLPAIKDMKLSIYIPETTELINDTLLVDGVRCTNFGNENNLVTIPLDNKKGEIRFTLKTLEYDTLVSYALMDFTRNGVKKQEIVGVVHNDIPILSLATDEKTSNENIAVSGITMPGNTVELYINGEKTTTVTALKTGKYSAILKLPNVCDYRIYHIKAVSSDINGSEITAETSVVYRKGTPELVEFTMEHNNQKYVMTEQLGLKPVITFAGNKEFKFKVKFTNPNQIEKVFIVSDRNNVIKRMEATWNASTGLFEANGFFDPQNTNYVPGTINIEYIEKEEKHYYNEEVDFTTERFTGGLSDEWKNATVETVTNTETEQEHIITLADDNKTQIRVSTKESSIPEDFSPQTAEEQGYLHLTAEEAATVLSGLQLYANSNEDVYVRTTQGDDFINADFVFLASDIYLEFTENAIGGSFSSGLSSITSIIDYAQTESQLNKIERELYQSGRSDKEIAFYQEDIDCARALNTLSAAISVTGTLLGIANPTLGIMFSVANIAINACADQAMENLDRESLISKKSGVAKMSFRWAIDPSGYVYDATTNERLAGVKVTLYYKETESSVAVLWDAAEYEQANPLLTNVDGCYAWDVPEGIWQVKYELHGYETAYSEWLPVPPPQTNVNIGLTPLPTEKAHTEVIDKAVAATCTKDGLTEGKHCSVCNEVLVKQEVVKALGHSWDGGVVTKKATTTETGVKTYTCTRCQAAYTETIAKLPITIVFDDVTSGTDWFAPYVNDLVFQGILNGKGTRADGTPYFEPLGLITRGEFSKILAAASGDDLTAYSGNGNFNDTVGHWASAYINWAYEKGIVTGFPDGTFAPDASITREQMAVMICRYAEYKGITLPKVNDKLTFTDGNLITWSADAVYAMQQAGIINGYNENGGCYFKPQNNATRAEAAKMISCFLDL